MTGPVVRPFIGGDRGDDWGDDRSIPHRTVPRPRSSGLPDTAPRQRTEGPYPPLPPPRGPHRPPHRPPHREPHREPHRAALPPQRAPRPARAEVRTPDRSAERSSGRLGAVVRFGLVGLSGIVVNQLVLWALVDGLGWNYLLAAVLSAEVSIASNFALTEHWVFTERRHGSVLARAAGFALVANSALLLQVPLLGVLTGVVGLHYLVSNLVSVVVVFGLRYVLSERLIWSSKQAPRHRRRGTARPPRWSHLPVRAVLLALVAGIVAAAVVDGHAVATIGITGVTVVLLTIAVLSLSWQTYAWRTPQTYSRTGLPWLDEPRLSFSVLVPARHEEAVLGATIAGLAACDHPSFEIVVIVGHDDPGTAAVAHQAAAQAGVPVTVVVDHNPEKNKPKALNTGLPYCSGDVVMVIDAEDDVQPGLLRLADAAFRRHSADVVQTGIQLVDFDKSWWTGRNVLEYFFWFRSRLHFHAAQRFITLGGTGVAVRRDLLNHLGGWDESCLAEDCDLGVRASVLGAKVVVVYEPAHTTLEETPTDVRAFFRQRVRWMQGFMQVLAKQDWRRLPTRRQRLQALVVLGTPVSQSFTAVMAPLCAAAAFALKSPVLVAMVTFLPLVPTAISLAFDVLGLHDFGRTFRRRIGLRSYVLVLVSLPAYQTLLAAATLWAVARQLRRQTDWHKTHHTNAHRPAAVPLGEAA